MVLFFTGLLYKFQIKLFNYYHTIILISFLVGNTQESNKTGKIFVGLP
jgi:hypothetical protein